MTDPNNPFPIDAPDLISVGAQSIVDRSKSLGLVWTRRMGTVVDGETDPANVTLTMDGDTAIVTAASMVGALSEGTRVYVDMVPPAANFITGVDADSFNPLLFDSKNTNTALSNATTTSASYTDLPGSPQVTLVKNYVNTRIRIDMNVTVSSSLANTNARFAAQLGGTTDVDVAQILVNPANTHLQAAGTLITTWAAAGAVTIIGRWRRVAGGGTLTLDGNDWFSLTAAEIT